MLKFCKFINSLPLNKASGLDNTSVDLLKEAALIVTSSLTFIISHSIFSETVPDEWKHASVSPVFKEGAKVDLSNHRPISVLPVVVSKLVRELYSNNCRGT